MCIRDRGKIMDAGHSPKGKCRPWFLRMAIPTLVMIVMMFTVPKNAGSGFQMGYVLITNILLSAVDVYKRQGQRAAINSATAFQMIRVLRLLQFDS